MSEAGLVIKDGEMLTGAFMSPRKSFKFQFLNSSWKAKSTHSGGISP